MRMKKCSNTRREPELHLMNLNSSIGQPKRLQRRSKKLLLSPNLSLKKMKSTYSSNQNLRRSPNILHLKKRITKWRERRREPRNQSRKKMSLLLKRKDLQRHITGITTAESVSVNMSNKSTLMIYLTLTILWLTLTMMISTKKQEFTTTRIHFTTRLTMWSVITQRSSTIMLVTDTSLKTHSTLKARWSMMSFLQRISKLTLLV